MSAQLRDGLLSLLADQVDDLEKTRIANENRLRQLTRDETDADGETRGLGLGLDVPEVRRAADIVDGLAAMEHQAVLSLRRQVRKHPLWERFASKHRGLGEKQFARLLAAIGDPYWNDLHDRPRTVSELWAFCGYHVITASGSGHDHGDDQTCSAAAGSTSHPDDQGSLDTHTAAVVGVAPFRQRGRRSNWSTTAKMRAFLIAESCIKQPAGNKYRDIYQATRDHYADATHQVECKRCGPSGKPAQPGSDLSNGHKHARATRKVAKEILKDVWISAKSIHDETARPVAA